MLITKLKPREELHCLNDKDIVLLYCEGCKEVYFPENEIAELEKELSVNRTDLTVIATDYVCNPEHLEYQMRKYANDIKNAGLVLVFSCGVGVQTIADSYPEKKVCAACDTIPLPGWQGLTPPEYDCDQCGECHLNDTGGICPITACSKSLVNGQCGGAKNGKCEADGEMDCGWERIYRRLENQRRLESLRIPAKLRNFAVQTGKAD